MCTHTTRAHTHTHTHTLTGNLERVSHICSLYTTMPTLRVWRSSVTLAPYRSLSMTSNDTLQDALRKANKTSWVKTQLAPNNYTTYTHNSELLYSTTTFNSFILLTLHFILSILNNVTKQNSSCNIKSLHSAPKRWARDYWGFDTTMHEMDLSVIQYWVHCAALPQQSACVL